MKMTGWFEKYIVIPMTVVCQSQHPEAHQQNWSWMCHEIRETVNGALAALEERLVAIHQLRNFSPVREGSVMSGDGPHRTEMNESYRMKSLWMARLYSR